MQGEALVYSSRYGFHKHSQCRAVYTRVCFLIRSRSLFASSWASLPTTGYYTFLLLPLKLYSELLEMLTRGQHISRQASKVILWHSINDCAAKISTWSLLLQKHGVTICVWLLYAQWYALELIKAETIGCLWYICMKQLVAGNWCIPLCGAVSYSILLITAITGFGYHLLAKQRKCILSTLTLNVFGWLKMIQKQEI